MARRNFIVVDDIPELGEKVERFIKHYYNSKRIYEYDIKTFLAENHFAEAKQYIEKYSPEIDIIFSDQNLRGGKGTELFKLADRKIETDYESIQCSLHMYRVMHSNVNARFVEHQKGYALLYDYFVNSENENNILEFLDYYESNILLVKQNGNSRYTNYLYQSPELKKQLERGKIVLDKTTINYRDIMFLVMDKDRGNSEYYYFFYDNGNEVIKSAESKKPEAGFNKSLEKLLFLEGTLSAFRGEKFKVNPLWLSSIDTIKNVVKLLPRYNFRHEIKFDKLEDFSSSLLENDLDNFLK